MENKSGADKTTLQNATIPASAAAPAPNNPRLPKTATQLAIEKRQIEVFKMTLLGLSKQKIADTLGISREQVYRDLGAINADVLQRVNKERKDAIIAEVISEQDERKSQLWTIAKDAKAPLDKRMKALDMLGDEEDRYWKKLQAMGIAPREVPLQFIMGDQNVQINNNDNRNIIFGWGENQEDFNAIQAQARALDSPVIDVTPDTRVTNVTPGEAAAPLRRRRRAIDHSIKPTFSHPKMRKVGTEEKIPEETPNEGDNSLGSQS